MFVTKNSLAELIYYLKTLQEVIKTAPLQKPLYSDGTTIGQVAFHTAESASDYLTTFILNREYPRNRDEEFHKQQNLEEITSSIDKALGIIDQVSEQKIEITQKLQKTKLVKSIGFEITTVFETLQHVTAHTADHVASIKTKLE